ncbi:S-adenosyl-L-methionine-dependent methyltransferase [Patellaria atrata CBS 101060]|uniref:S-adenosyl-L-methionine-dependent methyltransferase n=1 Tax=Patellaria atrata CBS 101060 TaxID=1346257 RepID=A0A9P4SE60_9PEZI|nr:S-adenosyl-L-methionine-dependent methyltransferase [Patellaria atrata CBS 101060]
MGKRGNKNGRGRGRGRGGRGGGGGGSRDGWRTNWTAISKEHEKFERYYNKLGILEEGEKEQFWEAMRRELPSSFRFAGSRGHALAVQKHLIDHYIPQITSVQWEGKNVDPPRPIEWYPERLAWSMNTPKQVIRKFPPFSAFQKFLVSETTVGNITRQEVVSMIPPLLLDVKPGMKVLDMCAAPGSKTSQLIEMVHGGEEARVRDIIRKIKTEEGRELSPDGFEIEVEKSFAAQEGDWTDDGRSTGLLIANDSDYRRAQMLVHQVKRLNSPNLLVMNHDATMFPSIKLPTPPGARGKYLKFDRILADVPCSGDGTVRKNPNIWKDWLPANALGLHTTQTRILVRALQMLKVKGRVVYSTCSLNPIENEAVIASAIERCGGNTKVKILDMSDALPGLKRKPGLTDWKIMDRNGKIWDSYEDARDELGEDNLGRISDTMFPPPPTSEDERLPLERCLRVYPHMQDTGGFFITVLEKLTEIRARNENAPRTEKSQISDNAIKDEMSERPAPISDLVDEIKNRTENGVKSYETSEALEAVAPITEPDNGNYSAAVRQNTPPPAKRVLEEQLDGGSSPKKARLHGTAEKIEHWPPPPATLVDERIRSSEPFDEVMEEDTTEIKEENAPAIKEEDKTGAKEEDAPLIRQETTASDRCKPPTKEYSDYKKKSSGVHEEPFKYLNPEHVELERIFKFYTLSSRFPRDRFMVRNATGEPVKSIYYTSVLSREILTENEGKGLKFVHSGVKMFVKQDAQTPEMCPWRIQSEGLPIVEAWVGEERIVRLYKRETLRKLLVEMFPKVGNESWKELGEIGERVRDIGGGCCVLRVEKSDAEDGFEQRIVLPLWRSVWSLNLMLPKDERKAMLLRLFNDDTPLIDHSQNRNKPPTPRDISPSLSDVSIDNDAEGGVLLDPAAREAKAGEGTAEAQEVEAAKAANITATAADAMAADVEMGDEPTNVVTEEQAMKNEGMLRAQRFHERDKVDETELGQVGDASVGRWVGEDKLDGGEERKLGIEGGGFQG